METTHWLTIGIFLFSNLVTIVGIIFSTRVDTNKLKDKMAELAADMSTLQKDMKQFGQILVTLADFKGEMNLIQERQLAQGRRIDEHIKDSNDRERRWQSKFENINSGGG
jgi:hypothetical protein